MILFLLIILNLLGHFIVFIGICKINETVQKIPNFLMLFFPFLFLLFLFLPFLFKFHPFHFLGLLNLFLGEVTFQALILILHPVAQLLNHDIVFIEDEEGFEVDTLDLAGL